MGKKSLLGKAKARPDLVKQFMDKAKKEGFLKTFKEALGRLDNPTPLGYSSAGVIIEAGSNVHKFSPGDRVACIGAGYASHAEWFFHGADGSNLIRFYFAKRDEELEEAVRRIDKGDIALPFPPWLLKAIGVL